MYPTDITLFEEERALEITWESGEKTRFSLTYLRGWCPCAGCQGHFQGVVNFHRRAKIKLLGLDPVGNYAMQPHWSDGHDSGMYSWSYLRHIATTPPAEGPTNEELLAEDAQGAADE